MRNFKSFSSFVGFIRSKLTPKTLYYSCYCNNSTAVVVKSIGTYSSVLRNELLVPKEVSSINFVLSRNLSLSGTLCSKSKDRGGKEKKKPKAAKLDLRELEQFLDVEELTGQMKQAIENLKLDFIKNLSLRSTTGDLEQLPVKVDDKEYQLQELAQIARKPKLIVLNVAAFPTAIPQIIKAIEESGLNMNPQQDGTTLFLPIPKVTKEHRENLAKNAKAIFIKYRDQIKDVRNQALKTLKKKKDVSEDAIYRASGHVEALCEKYLKEAESITQSKQNELLKAAD